MSLQNIPTVPGIDASAIKSLTRLCSGETDGLRPEIERPHLIDVGDDVYLTVTDGSTIIMFLLEEGLPDPTEVPSNPVVSEKIGTFMAEAAGDHSTFFEDVDVAKILEWCAVGTKKCPQCSGTKLCMFPRHGSTSYHRENPDVMSSHEGIISGVLVDRRRIQVPLMMLGVDEGPADLVVYQRDVETVKTADGNVVPGPISAVALVGGNWRIYSAGLAWPAKGPKDASKIPTFDL